MQVIASGLSLPDRARHRATRGLLLLAVGLVLIAATLIASEQGWALAGGVMALLGFGALLTGWMQINASRRDRRQMTDEAPVLAQLRARLGDGYTYVRHLRLSGQVIEVDGLLLGPHGLLVLGIHSQAGRITVRGNDWFVVDDRDEERPIRESPTWALTRRQRAVYAVLTREGLGHVPIQAAVVLVDGDLERAERPGTAVVPVSRIASYVDYLGQGKTAPDAIPPDPADAHPDGSKPGLNGEDGEPATWDQQVLAALLPAGRVG